MARLGDVSAGMRLGGVRSCAALGGMVLLKLVRTTFSMRQHHNAV